VQGSGILNVFNELGFDSLGKHRYPVLIALTPSNGDFIPVEINVLNPQPRHYRRGGRRLALGRLAGVAFALGGADMRLSRWGFDAPLFPLAQTLALVGAGAGDIIIGGDTIKAEIHITYGSISATTRSAQVATLH